MGRIPPRAAPGAMLIPKGEHADRAPVRNRKGAPSLAQQGVGDGRQALQCERACAAVRRLNLPHGVLVLQLTSDDTGVHADPAPKADHLLFQVVGFRAPDQVVHGLRWYQQDTTHTNRSIDAASPPSARQALLHGKPSRPPDGLRAREPERRYDRCHPPPAEPPEHPPWTR